MEVVSESDLSFFVYYGRNRAILITAPSEEEYRHSGIYVDDQDN